MHSCYSECERSSILLVMMILPFTHKLLKMIFFIFNGDRKDLIIAVELSIVTRSISGPYSSSAWWPLVPNFCSRATRKSSFFSYKLYDGHPRFYSFRALVSCLLSLEQSLEYYTPCGCIVMLQLPFTVQSALADNPLSPNGDQHQFSPNNIHTLSRD